MPKPRNPPLQGPFSGTDAIFGVAGNQKDFYRRCTNILLDRANQGDVDAMGWVRRLRSYGITKNLVRQLLEVTADYKVLTYPDFDASRRRFYLRQHFPTAVPYSDDEYLALLVMQAINGGISREQIKECKASDCSNLHIRKGKWCTDDCGNRMRVYKSRSKSKSRENK